MSLLSLPASVLQQVLPHLETLKDLDSLSRAHSRIRTLCSDAPAETLIKLGIGTLRHDRAGYPCGLTDEKTMLLLLKIRYHDEIEKWTQKEPENLIDYYEICRQGTAATLGFLARMFARNIRLGDLEEMLSGVVELKPFVINTAGKKSFKVKEAEAAGRGHRKS
ncbi:hypothetical protein FN846DRAFT_905373 [Sphaerosporella brunnea]|uniref:F-box domain-containing protein n=1 Tax=Sphaerosporella brunnea TaxID=1250544 RepID=A0A5J5F201_9PEZI|nr:hypothetical protein FN846DRAFT_905373 [Sphaerosporella brunnea]